MEETYKETEKNQSFLLHIKSVKNTQFSKQTFIIHLNTNKDKCFFCLQNIKSIQHCIIKHGFVFCSRICEEIFLKEEIRFQKNIYYNNDKNINCLNISLLQEESQTALREYINKNRDECFEKIFVKYKADSTVDETGFKNIWLTFKYQKKYEFYKQDELYLRTIIFKLVDGSKYLHFLPNHFAKYQKPTSTTQTSLPTQIEETFIKRNTCLFCSQKLTNNKYLIRLDEDLNAYIGYVCSYFCSQVFLTLNSKHITTKETFFDFPHFIMLNESENVDFIKRFIKDVKMNPHFFIRTDYKEDKEVFEINKTSYE